MELAMTWVLMIALRDTSGLEEVGEYESLAACRGALEQSAVFLRNGDGGVIDATLPVIGVCVPRPA